MNILGLVLVAVLLSGCGDINARENWKSITVTTTTGEVFKMMCPVFESHPIGAHGRECYLLGVRKDD